MHGLAMRMTPGTPLLAPGKILWRQLRWIGDTHQVHRIRRAPALRARPEDRRAGFSLGCGFCRAFSESSELEELCLKR
jgi:hypothetical protein